MTLEDVRRAPLPDRLHEVAERMRAIEKALPKRDGARAFTSLIGWADEALLPLTAGRFALTLDRTVGFAGRGRLRPIG
jgi:hypothetical protein